ncbi:M15 family metallopeptidase [Stenotrophomonas indicatrix]|uniref:M15 family metallopeptidase n=1 Tax=Stenotrophomonas indicatrix TaxID=2045451 RepID=UPI003439C64D
MKSFSNCFSLTVVALALAGCSTIKPAIAPPPMDWTSPKPNSHGTLYRFFHPKQERVWKGVSPALREKAEAVLAQLAAEGYDVRPVEGYRSPERQAALMASASGVTSVGAHASCHNYGLALDSAVFINGTPSWDLDNPHVLAGYMRFGELSEIVGLNWGGRWTSLRDYPHVELKAECGQSKWAYRHGRKLPVFAAAGGPSSYVLARALAPSWCPAGMEAACLTWRNERRVTWSVDSPARVCFVTLPNIGIKIS